MKFSWQIYHLKSAAVIEQGGHRNRERAFFQMKKHALDYMIYWDVDPTEFRLFFFPWTRAGELATRKLELTLLCPASNKF